MKIFANFKMNHTPTETKDYLMAFLPKAKVLKHDIVLCLPFTSLAVAKYLTEGSNVKIGAQNICDEESGKCTGEVNGEMIKDAGASMVIIGHSERRSKYKEGSRVINKKIKIALKNRLGVVLCVGETLAERNTLKTAEILKEQLEDAFKGLYENELENIVVAYEPIWAIGSGTTPSAKEIDVAGNVIRKVVSADFSVSAGKNLTVVYGGSVNQKNIGRLSNAKSINGVLIGGACLDPNVFAQILSSVNG